MALDKFKWCVQVQNGGGQMTTTNNDRAVSFGNGYQQVGSSGFNTERREFEITYAGSKYAEVLAFLRSHRLVPFAFQPPGDTIGIFILKSDTLTTNPITGNLLEVKCTIVEQFTSM